MPRCPEPELRDLYADLGVTDDATQVDIKRSYRELVLKVHPDKQGDPAEFRKVHEAYETLRDPVKRQQYNEQREAHMNEDGGTSGFSSYSDDFRPNYFGSGTFEEFIQRAQARASAHNARRGYGSEEEDKEREEYRRECRRKEDEAQARRAEEEKLRVAAQKKLIIKREEEARINAILQENRIHDRISSKINSKKKKNAQAPSRKNCICQGCQDRFIRELNEKNQSKRDPQGHAERMRIRKEIAARKEKEAADKARQEAERLAEEQQAAEKAAEEEMIAREKAIAEQAARERLYQQIAEQEAKRRAKEQAAAEEAAHRRKLEKLAKREAEEAADRKAKEEKEAIERRAREFAERKAREASERESEEAAHRLAEQEARNAARLKAAERKAESTRRVAQEAAELAQQKAERDAEALRQKQETENLAARRSKAYRTKKLSEYIAEREAKDTAADKDFDAAFARDLHEVSDRMAKERMDRKARCAKIQCKFGSRCKYVASGTCHFMHQAIPQGSATEPNRNRSSFDTHQHGPVEYVPDTPEQNHYIKTQIRKLASKKVEEVAHHDVDMLNDKHTTDQGCPAATINGISPSDPKVKLAFDYIQNKKVHLINGLLDQGKHVPAGGIPIQLGWANLGFANKCHFCDFKKPKYTFRCPEGGAKACGRCKKGFSLVTPEDEALLLSRSSDA